MMSSPSTTNPDITVEWLQNALSGKEKWQARASEILTVFLKPKFAIEKVSDIAQITEGTWAKMQEYGLEFPTSVTDQLQRKAIAKNLLQVSGALHQGIALVQFMTKLPAVAVCGSWNRWEPIPMAYSGGEYTTNLVTVPTGFQQFKFKDSSGQWFCDLALPTILDNGNQNNCIDVKATVSVGFTTQSILNENGISKDGPLEMLCRNVCFGVDENKKPVAIKFRVTPQEVQITRDVLGVAGIIEGRIVEEKGRSILLMKMYVTNISKYIQLEPQIDEKYLLKQTQRIQMALQYLHTKNFIHADITPNNILADENSDWFLADFGSAAQMGSIMTSTSPQFLPAGRHATLEARPEIDLHMLAVTVLLFFESKITVKPGATPVRPLLPEFPNEGWAKVMLSRVRNTDLNALLLSLLELDD